MNSLTITALAPSGDVHAGDDLGELLAQSLAASSVTLENGDVVIVTSKIVSKAEGRVVASDGTESSRDALIAQESVRVLRRRGPLRITETPHGFVNANAGIDYSNTEEGTAVLLPVDPDKSARRLRGDLQRRWGVDVGVVITDTFGRTWRNGVVDVAIGSAGLLPILDLRGTTDTNGRTLDVTEVAIIDEIAAAANLVLPKNARTPFAVVRGLDPRYFGPGSIRDTIVRSPTGDLFR